MVEWGGGRMRKVVGKYAEIKVYADTVDVKALDILADLSNQQFIEGSKIRIMPDVHAGKGCCIGTTMTITDKVVPNLVGVDIGCGVSLVKLKDKEINFEELDKTIRKRISNNDTFQNDTIEHNKNLQNLRCLKDGNIKIDYANASLGTLGGGNHYIEVNKSDIDGSLYLAVHTGSRHLGVEVCNYYQTKAYAELKNTVNGGNLKTKTAELIAKLKSDGRESEISTQIKIFKRKYVDENPTISEELAYCEGETLKDYLHDMRITQEHAALNRKTIIGTIVKELGLTVDQENSIETIHNYIDVQNMILRKGAVSAQKGEKLVIPLNMRDGILVAIGKGNPDWNYSAPHGAGRMMSRTQANNNLEIDQFKTDMTSNNIYTTSVGLDTLDESPRAYKPFQEIMDKIQDTVEIVERLKPMYNFKAGNR